jgi:Zn-dependent peptidase ImmA (M78 family)/transcriptional regulator with XRE-family HTH domain
MSLTTRVSGDRIRQAREIRGLTQQELARIVKVDQSTVARWERDLLAVADAQLQSIALATSFPVAFFKQATGPEFPFGSLMNRARKALSSEDRDRVRQVGRLTFELASVLAERFSQISVHIPEVSAADPEKAAQITRNAFGLSPDTPLTSIINRLERNGVLVFAIPDEIDEHDAYSLWADTDPRRPVLVVSAGKPGDRLRWNVAHELGHLVMHRTSDGTLLQREDQADLFAAELLLPEVAMREELRPPLTLTRFAELKAKWGVSIQAVVNCAYQLEIITERQRKYLFMQLSALGWRNDEPVAIPLERPRLLRKMAEEVFGVPVDCGRVAQLIGAPARLVQEILDQHSTREQLRGASKPADEDRQPVVAPRSPGDVLDFPLPKRNGTSDVPDE